MLGRRLFLISCGWVLAGFAPAKTSRAGIPRIIPPSPLIETGETPPITLSIAGWDSPFHCEQRASSRVWISINRSWRVAWR